MFITDEEKDSTSASFDAVPEEERVIEHLVLAWNHFVALPKQHPNDIDEFRRCLHQLQHLVGIRRVRRIDSSWYNEERK